MHLCMQHFACIQKKPRVEFQNKTVRLCKLAEVTQRSRIICR